MRVNLQKEAFLQYYNDKNQQLKDELRTFARKQAKESKQERSLLQRLNANSDSELYKNKIPRGSIIQIQTSRDELKIIDSAYLGVGILVLGGGWLFHYCFPKFFSSADFGTTEVIIGVILFLIAVPILLIIMHFEDERKTAFMELKRLQGLSIEEAEIEYLKEYKSD